MASGSGVRNAGISRYCREIVGGLARVAPNDEFVVFLTTDTETPEDWRESPNLEVRAVAPPDPVKRSIWDRYAPARYGSEFDVWFATAHAAIPKRHSPKTMTMIQDMIPLTHGDAHVGFRARYLKWVLSAAAQSADRVITSAHYTAREISRLTGIPLSDIVVAPLGPGQRIVRADPRQVSDERLAEIGVKGTDYFLTLGTLEPRKNLPRLIEAFAGVPAPWRLAIAGGRGWADSPVFDAVERLGLKDRVDFLGYVDDDAIAPLMARSRAFVYPSVAEGYGLPTLEAMLADAPVLTSKGTAMEEICGPAARYFDPLSVDSIRHTLVAAAASDSDRDRWITTGRERSRDVTWENCARITHDALRDLAAS